MKFEPHNITDKQGLEITIREVRLSDSTSLQKCVKSYLKSKLIPLTQSEFEVIAVNHTEWIQKFIDGKNDLLLVAESNGEIIGNIDLLMNSREMLKHVGYIGMGIHEEWQGRGLGTTMLKLLVHWIDKSADINAVWLQVFGNNIKGLKLYSKLGFEKTGVQKNFIKTTSGEYIDNIIMTRYK